MKKICFCIENGEEKKNTDDAVHKSIDGTKRIKRKQEIVTMNKRKSENARTRVKEADRGRHEAELCNEDIRQEIKKIDYK
ncbi:Rho GTPase-activating protein [Trichinella pseudospiralis]